MESRPSALAQPVLEPIASVAEDLPELYRTILDRVAELERLGARPEAGRIRASATRAYSSAWDASAQRLLIGLLSRAERRLIVPTGRRAGFLRRRSVAAR